MMETNAGDVDVAVLADRMAVVDVCVTYTLALDSRDWTRLRTCFTDDAVADYGGLGTVDGYDAIEQTCRTALGPLTASHHFLGNHLVTVDGDRAESTCYLQAQHVRLGAPDGELFLVAGRYDDRLSRTGDGWRITHRTLTVVWTQGNPLVMGRAGEA
jgi:ketosteroid isomerase-like protein